MSNSIRLILFDVGGVLIELSGLAMFLSWLENRMTVEQVYTFWLASPIVRAFETGKIPADLFAEQLITELRLPVTKQDFLRGLSIWGQHPLPGAIELVRRLPPRYLRATLCNTNVVQWPIVLQHRELLSPFDHHFASHLTGKIKPDADAFEHVLATLDVRPSEAVFVDDSRLNVEAAQRLGIRAFQVKGPAEAERALHEAGITLTS
jgi:putative hydrolase of the HAD superfamily